ncbi:unnamed protein product [Peronospora farinosa]|uniref:Uncharacterized protein n=1 Tax=Peronospora farinosa TaxID=134698 RepID=A0ABN8CGK9_9STRA|nr:unnamed protein product [Peronospora farinosa]
MTKSNDQSATSAAEKILGCIYPGIIIPWEASLSRQGAGFTGETAENGRTAERLAAGRRTEDRDFARTVRITSLSSLGSSSEESSIIGELPIETPDKSTVDTGVDELPDLTDFLDLADSREECRLDLLPKTFIYFKDESAAVDGGKEDGVGPWGSPPE